MTFQWSKLSLMRMKGVDRKLIKCATISLQESEYDMRISWMGGLRTAEQQNAIYKSKCSQKDGYKRVSKHQLGRGLDVTPVDKETEEKAYEHFAELMFKNWEKLGYKEKLKWGCHWKRFVDKPHWEF